jgi:hypothetical protein
MSYMSWEVKIDFVNCFFFFFLPPVFNVTDQDGNKVTDEGILDYILKVSPIGY